MLKLVSEIEQVLRDLVAVPSYESERGVADYLARRLGPLEVDCERSELGNGRENLIARIGAGDRLYGLGAADTKSSLAAMLCVFEALSRRRDELGSEIVLMAVGGEEVGGIGSRAAVREDQRADGIIVGEPTNLGIMIGHKGVLRLNLAVRGRAAHASKPELGANAISLMCEAVRALEAYHMELQTRESPLYAKPSLCVTTIAGGRALNMVPDRCTVSIDRRVVPGDVDCGDREACESAIDRTLSACRPGGAQLDYTLEFVRYVPPASTPPSDPLVRIAGQSLRSVTGRDEAPSGFKACCDMGYFSSALNIPGIICGPGSLEQAHQAGEFVSRRELHQSLRLYAEIVLRWLEHAQKGESSR